jgi:hypothetical protein
MCSHIWKKFNEVFVCVRCGLTRVPDGRIIFDRKIANYKPKKRRGK